MEKERLQWGFFFRRIQEIREKQTLKSITRSSQFELLVTFTCTSVTTVATLLPVHAATAIFDRTQWYAI